MIYSDEIRRLVKEHGHEGYLKLQAALLEGETMPNGVKLPKRNPMEFSFRALWEGLVGPTERTLSEGYGREGYVENMRDLQEAVSTASFASATGQLVAAMVVQGYNSTPTIGDLLTTNMPSTLRDERVVGFTSLQTAKPVVEGEPYEESDFSDKYVTTQQAKRGLVVSVTEEAVTHDQTGQVLMRAGQIGEAVAAERERIIVRGVADVLSTERVYRPSGTAEQLYSAGNSNLLSTTTALNDWTDIQEVMAYHATTVTDDRETNDEGGGRPILWSPKVLLTATEQAGTAARIVGATQVSTAPGDTSVANMVVNPLPNILNGGSLTALSSPFLDEAEGADQWDDATDWFLGDFKRQFVWKEVWPLQVLRAPANDPAAFDRDVVARFKARYYGGINAIDQRYVIKVNGA